MKNGSDPSWDMSRMAAKAEFVGDDGTWAQWRSPWPTSKQASTVAWLSSLEDNLSDNWQEGNDGRPYDIMEGGPPRDLHNDIRGDTADQILKLSLQQSDIAELGRPLFLWPDLP